jgi:cytochrome c oxidase assembly protein subunit 15
MTLLQTLITKPSRKVLRRYALANLIAQILIVVTGGVVRLTGSGLGCPTWPKCTDESLTTVPEQGIHGFIEFANRTLTGVLVIIALLALIAAWRQPRQARKGLVLPAALVIVGIFVQAVVGGVSVWFKLNPWIVASHFLISGLLITVATVLFWRTLDREHESVPPSVYALAPWIAVVGSITVVVGVLVTGAGPHSGDADTPRNGLDLEILQHVHSYPGYALLALTLFQFGLLRRLGPSVAKLKQLTVWLLLAITVQAVIGVVQARTGVPPTLVALHMLGASVLISLITANFLAIRGKH